MNNKKNNLTLTEFKIESSFKIRTGFFLALILITPIIIAIQLFKLQILEGRQNKMIAEDFVSEQEIIVSPRGKVFDRNFITPEISQPLIYNHSNINIYLASSHFNYELDKIKKFIKDFAKIMGISYSYYQNKESFSDKSLKEKLKKKKNILLLKNITRKYQERASLFEKIYHNIIFVSSPFRTYTLGSAMSHISGYIGKPSQRDIKIKKIKSYQKVGKNGIELFYDSILRGKDGLKIKKRKSKKEKIIINSSPGNNLILTIDKKIQSLAYKILQENELSGSVIVLKPASGEILALVSNPSYNPNILSNQDAKKRKNHFLEVQKRGGFLNLATQAKFPPASQFKPLVALTGLENNYNINFSKDTKITCKGNFLLKSTLDGVKDQRYFCWFKKGHGTLNLIGAIANSCNVYFYNLGYLLGSQPILMYANLFGLGEKTTIDLPGERTGFIPSPSWKLKKYGSRWFDGDTINLSIGQGYISTTPLALTSFYMSVLNNGKLYQPHILKEVREPITNKVISRFEPKLLKDIPLKENNLNIIKKALRMGVKYGTSSGIFRYLSYPEIAGKTGTAQTVRRGKSISNHAWFIGYAPFDAPVQKQILISVFIKYGVSGAFKAAPVAREIFKDIFSEKKLL